MAILVVPDIAIRNPSWLSRRPATRDTAFVGAATPARESNRSSIRAMQVSSSAPLMEPLPRVRIGPLGNKGSQGVGRARHLLRPDFGDADQGLGGRSDICVVVKRSGALLVEGVESIEFVVNVDHRWVHGEFADGLSTICERRPAQNDDPARSRVLMVF